MTNSALVSVIMPAYNAAQFIEAAVKSVRDQNYTNWELIVIDDASTDGTRKILQKLSNQESRLRLITNETNKGPGISRNKGIAAAQGDFIAFLDADDLWKPQKLENQLKFMRENDVDVSYSSYERIDENGERRKEVVEALPFLKYEKLLKSNYVGNLTGIYNCKKLGKIYGPEVKKRQDWGLWLNAVKKADTARSIKAPLALYRLRKSSISGNKLEMLKYNFNIYHKVLGFSFLKSLKWLFIFLREHFFIKRKQLKKLQH